MQTFPQVVIAFRGGRLPARRAVAVSVGLLGLLGLLGWATPAEADTTVSVVLLPEGGATLRDATEAGMGLRRGIRSVEGLRYVYAGELLDQRLPPDAFFSALERLPGLVDQVRAGGGRRTAAEVDAVIRVFEENLDLVSRADLAQAYLLSALTECNSRNAQQCREGFAYVLRFRETFAYDTTLYPPQFADLFESTRSLLLGEGARGSLHIHTTPQGAEVFVDGRSVGPSPAIVDGLLEGSHYVTAKVPGYTERVERVAVEANAARQAQLSLSENGAALLLNQNLPRIRQELGRPQAGPAISAMDGYLPVNQVVLAIVRGPVGANTVAMYLYDLRTNFLLSSRDAAVQGRVSLAQTSERLARELYHGVSLDGRVVGPAGPDLDDGEVWEKWWFWTAVGAVVVSGTVAGVALTPDDPQVPSGRLRITGNVQ